MWTPDHLVLNTVLAAAASKRFSLKFAPVALIMILVNMIDLDHLFYFSEDDGTANSLALHPFHIYAGVIFSLLGLAALFDRERVFYYFCAMGGVAAHLTADALAFWALFRNSSSDVPKGAPQH